MNRIFISYRNADGKKDATRLAFDLNRVFGDDQVFFDKHDLVGGASWRAMIDRAIGQRPVVLLLVTPELVGAMHPSGGRCIDRSDDPIRGELLTARKAGALLVPLLTEGTTMPRAGELPPELSFVTEAHALKLRTEDWAHDLARLVEDLEAHGIRSQHAAPERKVSRTWLRWVGAGLAGLFAIGLLQEVIDSADVASPDASGVVVPPPPPAPTPPTEPEPRGAADALGPLDGQWIAVDARGHRLSVTMRQHGAAVELVSERMPVSRYADWQAYAQQLLMQYGFVVHDLVYRGNGSITPAGLEMAIQVYSGDGRGPLDTGNLSLVRDGRELQGSLWSHASQTQQPIRMLRP